MKIKCESCQKANVTEIKTEQYRVDSGDPDFPYLLCRKCKTKLIARALSPGNWYNLASKYGWWQYYLQDDFYDEDGTACQPEFPVDLGGGSSALELEDVRGNAKALMGYSLTRWHFDPELEDAWRSLDTDVVLSTLFENFDSAPNSGVRDVTLEVAVLLGESAQTLVEKAWCGYPQLVSLAAVAEGMAACLPDEIGHTRVVDALSRMENGERLEAMLALSHFQNRRTLDWIEKNVSSPIAESWGNLAASSRLDWSRAESWINVGRPLSLVALDALAAIGEPKTSFLKRVAPQLVDAPDPFTLSRVLDDYALVDSVPRVKRVVSNINANITTIAAT